MAVIGSSASARRLDHTHCIRRGSTRIDAMFADLFGSDSSALIRGYFFLR